MKKILTVLILFLSLSIRVEAEDNAVKQLDFKESILVALENNNEIRAMKDSLNATEQDIGIARSNFMPKIGVGEDFTTTNNPAQVFALKLNQRRLTGADFAGAPNSFNKPGNLTNFMTYGMVQMSVFNKQYFEELKIAKTQYSANAYVYLRKQEELVKNVAIAYLAIGTTEEYIKVAESGLKDAQEHLRVATIRNKSGLGLYSDVLRAKTEVTEAEQRLVSAQKNYKVAKRMLALLIGSKDDVEISNNSPDLALQDEDYYKQSAQERNDLKAMEKQVENAKNNTKLAQADWFPSLNLNASYNLYNQSYPFGADGQNYTASGLLSWNVFDGKRGYETRKAKDKVKEAQEYLEGLKKTVDFKVFEAFLGVEEANKNFELSQDALKSAEEGGRLVLKRWQSGLANFVDVTDAQANLDRARANFIKSQNDLKTQLLTLYYESGVIKKELNLEE